MAATRQVTLQGFQVALDLFPLRKESNYVTLNARLRVLKAPVSTPEDLKLAPAGLLGNETNSVLDQNANGMRLTDAAHNVRYLPAQSPDNKTLCTPWSLPQTWIAGDVFTVSCLFGAPASSTVTVDAVTFGSIPNVPVQ